MLKDCQWQAIDVDFNKQIINKINDFTPSTLAKF